MLLISFVEKSNRKKLQNFNVENLLPVPISPVSEGETADVQPIFGGSAIGCGALFDVAADLPRILFPEAEREYGTAGAEIRFRALNRIVRDRK